MQNYKTMSPSELSDWQNRVNDFIVNIHPSLTAISAWADMPQSFYGGCELAMCIIRARDFAKRPKQYKPQQAVRILHSHLADALTASGYVSPSAPVHGDSSLCPSPSAGAKAPSAASSSAASPSASPSAGAKASSAASPSAPVPAASPAVTSSSSPSGSDDRGAHLSDYIHLLNETTKKKTDRLSELYLQQTALSQSSNALAKTYEDAERKGDTALMDITAKEAAPFNRELVQVNQDIRDIWADVDECVDYYRVHGSIMPEPTVSCDVSHDLSKGGVAAAHAGTTNGGIPVGKKPAECTKAEIDGIVDPATQHLYELARIDANKKYLRRNDLSHTDEWRAQVRLRAQELIDWDIKLSKKTKQVMELAGCADL